MAFVVTAVTAEVVTVASIASAVAELGMAMSVVGAVTGSTDLTKIGGVLSLAGGVTSLASGTINAAEGIAADGVADGLGEVAADSVESEAANSAITSAAGNAGEGIIGNAMNSAGDLSATGPMDSGVGFGGSSASPATNAVDTTTDAAVNAAQNTASASQASSAPVGSTEDPRAAIKSETSTNPVDTDPYLNETNKLQRQAIAPPPGSDAFSWKKWWKDLPESTKNLVMQSGMKAVGGLFQGWTEEQKQDLERNKFQFEQDKFNTAMANANAQPPVTQYQIKPGIINAAIGAK